MSSQKKVSIPVAVFSIGSGSVFGIYGLVSNINDRPNLLSFSHTEAIPSQEMDISRFVDLSVSRIDLVIKELQKKDLHSPEYIQIILGSPWYRSQTRTIIYTKSTKFICTKELIDSLISKEVEYLMKNDNDLHNNIDQKSFIVEKQISSIKLNGYSTNIPYNKKTNSLEISFTVTIVSKLIIDRFVGSLRRVYGDNTISITTNPYAIFVVQRDYFDGKNDCLVMDIGEELTDIAFVKDGVFLYQHSFPVGTHAIYRILKEKLGYSIVEAKTALESYRLKKIDLKTKSNIEKGLTIFIDNWRRGLEKILDEGHYGFSLPEYCFVNTEIRYKKIFKQIIETDPFLLHACPQSNIKAIFNDDNNNTIPIGLLFAARSMYYNKDI